MECVIDEKAQTPPTYSLGSFNAIWVVYVAHGPSQRKLMQALVGSTVMRRAMLVGPSAFDCALSFCKSDLPVQVEWFSGAISSTKHSSDTLTRKSEWFTDPNDSSHKKSRNRLSHWICRESRISGGCSNRKDDSEEAISSLAFCLNASIGILAWFALDPTIAGTESMDLQYWRMCMY